LGDDGLSSLIPIIVNNTKLRVLKLVKNKLTDVGAGMLISLVLEE
jgi:hypothetical protein